MELSVDLLRSLFRNLAAFQSLYESEGVDTVTDPDGNEWSLWDIKYVYEWSLSTLPKRQAQAVEYFLYLNLRESDVAKLMGLKPTNPIGMYATSGLQKVVYSIQEGDLPNFGVKKDG